MRWLKDYGSFSTLSEFTHRISNYTSILSNVNKKIAEAPQTVMFYGLGRMRICSPINPVEPQQYSGYQRAQKHDPSEQCYKFGHFAGSGDSLSRDWLVKLWQSDVTGRGCGRKRRHTRQWHSVYLQHGDALFQYRPYAQFIKTIYKRGFRSGEKKWAGTTIEHCLNRPIDESLPQHTTEEVGLAPLLARGTLVITRDIEWGNIMFAFEQESRYAIVDASYPESPVGSILEKSNVIFRQLLRSRRPFIAYVADAKGNEIFRVRRPFWMINSTIYAEVDGKEVGVVHRRWHLWRRLYDLYLGNRQFAAVENPGFWNWTFTLKDEESKVLAQIDRDWRGVGLELFTDAGQYVIRFGSPDSSGKFGSASVIQESTVARPLTLVERAVTVALAISLDSDYFSRSRGLGLPILVAGE